MKHELPKLDYAKNALSPIMSEETLDLHHGKHHQTYITKLNEFIEGTEMKDNSLEEIISPSAHARAARARRAIDARARRKVPGLRARINHARLHARASPVAPSTVARPGDHDRRPHARHRGGERRERATACGERGVFERVAR